jgi:hypothetical protein
MNNRELLVELPNETAKFHRDFSGIGLVYLAIFSVILYSLVIVILIIRLCA